MRRLTIIAAVCLVFVVGLLTVSAQDSAPVPTKTPTPAPEVTAESPVTEFEPLTQDDLHILTGNVQRPNGIALFNDYLYTACTGDSTIYEINSQSGLTSTYIWGIMNAHTLYVEDGSDRQIHLWVPDYTDNTLKQVTRLGVQRVASGLEGPWGITYLDDENFLVTNLMGNSISRVSRTGDNTPVLQGLSSPTGIVIDGDHVYVANNGSARRAIEWYPLDELAAAAVPTAAPTDQSQVLVSGVQNPTGLQLGADGYLYFAYSLANRGVVGRVDPQTCLADGGCSNADVEIVLYTDLTAPLAGLAISPDMRIFVHTMFAPELYWAQISS